MTHAGGNNTLDNLELRCKTTRQRPRNLSLT
jgi:hypothetical protein